MKSSAYSKVDVQKAVRMFKSMGMKVVAFEVDDLTHKWRLIVQDEEAAASASEQIDVSDKISRMLALGYGGAHESA